MVNNLSYHGFKTWFPERDPYVAPVIKFKNMKNILFSCLFLISLSSFSQTFDPLQKGIEYTSSGEKSEKADYSADHSHLFGAFPKFLASASDSDLIKIFSAENFERLTTSDLGVAYERKNGIPIQRGDINEILRHLALNKERISKAASEKPQVEINDWFGFEERSENWPCGLVLIFRNKQLTHVWIDLN